MSTHQQKALILPVKQGNWEIGEIAIPTPGPREVLVKIISTGLNPIDWKVQARGMFITHYPFIAGGDAAGTIEQVGPEVTNFAIGDNVVFQGWFENTKATFQQYAIAPAEITAKIPENISFDQAATVPLTLATVFTGIWNHHPQAKSVSFPAPWEEGGQTKFAGKPAFITGGASSVGQYAIQLAKLQNFSPIITTASPHNEALLRSLGATHVLDRTLPAAAALAEIRRITGGMPIEYAYDAIGTAETQGLALDAAAAGVTVVSVQPPQVSAEKLKVDEAEGKRTIQVFGSVHTPENRQVGVEVYKRLTEWLRDGTIVPNKVEVLPNGLAGIPDGLERLKQNKVSGTKLIAHPQETP